MKPFRNALAFAPLALASFAAAAPVQYGGNGHYYDFVLSSLTYSAATTAAASLSYMGMAGHLATWEDPGELNFIGTTFTSDIPSGGIQGFWLGAGSTATSPNTFTYVTGAPADTTGFVIDHAESSTAAEGLGIFNLDGSNPYYGDYIASNQGYVVGYIVEYQPTPEPTAFAALGLGAVAVLRRRKRA